MISADRSDQEAQIEGRGILSPAIFGGMFALEVPSDRPTSLPLTSSACVTYFANARSALYCLLLSLRPNRIWIPDFVCPAVIDAVTKAGIALSTYAIDGGLRLCETDWLGAVDAGDAVLTVDYFGFPFDLNGLRGLGATIIADCCQALFKMPNWQDADYFIASPRKFVGVPDGGILVSQSPLPINLQPAPLEWQTNSLNASLARRAFDEGNGDDGWFAAFQENESLQPTGPFSMSAESKELIARLDYEFIAAKRRENYKVLSSILQGNALFPELEDDVVPLGFPIRVERRDDLQQKLFANKVFAPIHWHLSDADLDGLAFELSEHILTLPCDQRYTSEQMTWLARLVKSSI